MAWITEGDFRRVVSSSMGLASPASLPARYDEQIEACVESAYQFIRAALAGRNFTPAQIESWASKRVYNRRVALCEFYEEVGLPETVNPSTLDRACKAKDELLTIDLIDTTGVIIEPGGTSAGVGYGDSVDDDDPDGGGPFGRITLDSTL